MGLWDTLKQHAGAQFLEVCEWLDDSNDTIVYRYPVFNQAITDNSRLVVREGQAAVFVAEGKLSDVFGPGTYRLDTRNTPILSFFKTIAYNFNYPYKGDIYFVNTHQFTENKWGTPNPIMMRDAEFGPVRIRAFGIYSYRVTDPTTFLRQLVGTDGLFTTDEINGQLKRKLVSALADSVGAARIPVLDLAANYMSLGDGLRDRMNPTFQAAYGITLVDMTIENISLPEEVEKALDTRTKMGVLGNLDAYAKMQAADALGTAAANPGLAGAGVGMGVGFGMGNVMGNQMAQAGASPGQFNPHTGMQGPPSPAPPPLPSSEKFHYHGHTGQAELTADEIVSRIEGDRDGKHMLWRSGWSGWKPWGEVSEIASRVPPVVAGPDMDQIFHYHGPGGDGEKTLREVVECLVDTPDGKHFLWQSGWDAWKQAVDVQAIQDALLTEVPPPPPGGEPPPPPD